MNYINELKENFDSIPLRNEQKERINDPQKIGFSFLINECGLSPDFISYVIDKSSDIQLKNFEDIGLKVQEREILKIRLKKLENLSK